MHTASYYNSIVMFPVFAFMVLVHCVYLALYCCIKKHPNSKNARKLMEATTRLAFPTIFSAHAVADHIKSRVDSDDDMIVEVASHKKQIYLEDRKPVCNDFRFKLYSRLFHVACSLLVLDFSAFVHLLLIDVSYDCDYGKECFWIDSPSDSLPLNCSEVIEENAEFVCYQLQFDFTEAFAISYALFKIASLLCHILAVVTIAFVGSNHCGRLSKKAKAWLARLIAVPMSFTPLFIALAIYYFINPSVPITHVFVQWRKAIFQVVYAAFSVVLFMFTIPWEDIVDKSKMEKLATDEPITTSTTSPGSNVLEEIHVNRLHADGSHPS